MSNTISLSEISCSSDAQAAFLREALTVLEKERAAVERRFGVHLQAVLEPSSDASVVRVRWAAVDDESRARRTEKHGV